MSGYQFTNEWSTQHESDWRDLLAPLVGKPGVQMAEIGSFEGRSGCWFLDNVLTGDGARLMCIDPWANYDGLPGEDMQMVFERFTLNIAATGRSDRVFTYRMGSEVLADGAHAHYFDAIYIDGDHSASAVLFDAVNAWHALKVGGLLMFDDYAWSPPDGSDDKPRKAIDAFMEVMAIGGRSKVERMAPNLAVLRRTK